MSWIGGLGQRLRVVLRFSRVESELDRELRDHLELEVQRQLRDGLPPEEARRRAALRFGNLDALKEETRDERGSRFIMDAIGDLRIGWRGLRRNPVFTLAAVLSLALGAAGTTAIFSIVHAVLLRPLPYPDADRLHLIRIAWGDFTAPLSAADLLRLTESSKGVAEIGAFVSPDAGFTMMTGSGPEVVPGSYVTPELPRVLGISPVLGRRLSNEPGAREVLISTELWQRRFGGKADVLGRGITLDSSAYAIVGVMPAGYNVPGQAAGDVWVGAPVDEPTRRGPYYLRVLARLAPTVTAASAATRLTGAVVPVLQERYRADPDWLYQALPMKEVLVGDVRLTLLLLLGAVGLVLLIAVVNVANLLLARGTARARELAMRASLGAGRERLARQLLTESALLGLLSGVAGLGIALLLLEVLGDMARTFVPRLEEVRLNPLIIGFALTLGIGAGLLAGVLPVFRLTWGRLNDVLRAGGRGSGESVHHGRTRRLLVAAEIALTLTVLSGATLLVKSLIRVQTMDPGFHAQGVLSFRLSLPDEPYEDTPRLDQFLTTLETRLRGLPGVTSVAYSSSLPPNRLRLTNNYTVEGSEQIHQNGTQAIAEWINTTPDFFSTLGIPLLRGRGFTAADRDGTPRVAIVNEAFVRRHFPNGQALGKRFKGGDWDPQAPWITIAGVVGDVPYDRGMWGGISPTVYLPMAQNQGDLSPYVVIKTAGDPNRLVPSARQAVLSVDPQLPLRDVASLQERLEESTAAPRFRSLLLSLLAGVALIVAVTGIYGVLAYHVNQQRRETAIRRALGAPATQVVAAVVGAGLRLTTLGVVIGLAGGLALARSLSSLLFDVQPNDPQVFVQASGILIVAAVVACALPAIRAARIHPMSILREE